MGSFKDDMRQWKEDAKKDFKKANADFKAGHEEIKSKYSYTPKQQSEQEKLAKTANMWLKGFALWYMIPFIGVALILMLFAGFWVWDTIVNLF